MRSTYITYVVILLIGLTQHFVTALTGNVTSEQKTLAKTLTSFLKVPWINLNSSWTDEVTSACRNDIVTLFESAENGEMWALKMLDAASKVPAGIFTGNIFDLGMFDECVSVKGQSNPVDIEGQHCMISLSMPTKFYGDTSKMMRIQKINVYNPSADVAVGLSMSVCLPSSCSVQDINGLVNASVKEMPMLSPFEVGVARVTCSNSEPLKLTIGSIFTISFFGMIAVLLVFCTACEFVLKTKFNNGSTALKNAAKFSLYTNLLKLTSTKSKTDSMPAIHGIRTLSMCLIVTLHRVVSTSFVPKVNSSDFNEVLSSMLSAVAFTASFVVDTFFLMSGFLVAHLFLKTLRSGRKFNLITVYLLRYIRFIPSLAVVLLFVVFIISHLGSGWIWETVIETEVMKCRENWWANVLCIHNIMNVDQMCLLHTWYLAAEMQMFWLSLIILYSLFYRPKLGQALLGLLLIASFITPAVIYAVNGWSAWFAMQKSIPVMTSELSMGQTATYNRALPYLIGILLGYDVIYNKREMSKMHVALNWILALISLILCGWISSHIQPISPVYNTVWETTYVSVGRLLWSISTAWVIYACTQGYGGLLTKFLSLPIFILPSRLSFNVYLVHIILQATTIGAQRTTTYVMPSTQLYQVWGDLGMSFLIAFVLCLFIEYPVATFVKIFIYDSSSARVECGSRKLKTRLSAALQKYLNLSRDLFSPECITETTMVRPDFWQTISSEMNALTKGSPKTADEWLKVWQEWRSELLKIDSLSETELNRIQKKEVQDAAGIVEMEKELMVFVAAVNCGSNDSTSSSASNAVKLKSQ